MENQVERRDMLQSQSGSEVSLPASEVHKRQQNQGFGSAWTEGTHWFSDLFSDPCVSRCTHQHDCDADDLACICRSTNLAPIYKCLRGVCSTGDATDFMSEVKEYCDNEIGDSSWLNYSAIYGSPIASSSSSEAQTVAPTPNPPSSQSATHAGDASNSNGAGTLALSSSSNLVGTPQSDGIASPQSVSSSQSPQDVSTGNLASQSSQPASSSVPTTTIVSAAALAHDPTRGGLTTGAIVAIAISPLGLLAVVLLAVWLIKRHRKRHPEMEEYSSYRYPYQRYQQSSLQS